MSRHRHSHPKPCSESWLEELIERFLHRHHHAHPKIRAAVVRLTFGDTVVTFIGDWIMQVPSSGGPFTADITNFVDDAGNPTTDTDVPVWASSDPTIATVVVGDSTKPQEATVTLTKAIGQTQITATFGDVTAGGFVVTGSLEVVAGKAVSATMTFTGPGISAPAAKP